MWYNTLTACSEVLFLCAKIVEWGFAQPPAASYNESEVLFVYAVIFTGGKQYKVAEGDVVSIEKLDCEAGSEITFDKVLAVGDDSLKVGAPYVEGESVEAKVIENGKAKKIVVFKYKSKKNERKKQGHRQPFTKVMISKIKA